MSGKNLSPDVGDGEPDPPEAVPGGCCWCCCKEAKELPTRAEWGMMSPVGVPAAAAATDEAAEAVLKWPPVLITTTPANIKYIKVMTKLTLYNGLIDIEVLSIFLCKKYSIISDHKFKVHFQKIQSTVRTKKPCSNGLVLITTTS